MNDFQESLQELLAEKNMSRLKLAKELGISSTTINGYFNNNYYPKIEIALAMAKYFDCSLDYLFGLSDLRHAETKNRNSFFENLDALIKSTGKSVAQTMKNLKMSEFNYYRWRDGMLPKTVNLIDIAKHFAVSLDFLLGNLLNA